MKRSPRLSFPTIRLRRTRKKFLPDQVCDAIRDAIASGALPPGSRLPGSRVISSKLKVSRNTVLAAYESLAFEGLIAGRVGSGTRVCADAAGLVRLHATANPHKFSRLREAGFPLNSVNARDPDGHAIYIHS